MAAFMWTVVILMAAAMLAEIVAIIGIALVTTRAARRSAEIVEQAWRTLEPSVRLANELQQSLLPRVESIRRESSEIAELVKTRTQSVQAALDDTSRRAERIRLRLMGGAETVEGHETERQGVYQKVVEPIQTASRVVRGLKIALWILRKVA